MLVGLYDYDMLFHGAKFIPNLELMQYSAYHKQNGDIVRMLYHLADSDSYDKIIVAKQVEDKVATLEILKDPRVDWIGRAFLGPAYHAPIDIASVDADTSIYDSFFDVNKDTYSERSRLRLERVLQKGRPTRITCKSKPIMDFTKVKTDKEYVALYDDDLIHTDGLIDILNHLQESKLTFVYTQRTENHAIFTQINQHPIKITNYGQKNAIIYTGTLTREDLHKLQFNDRFRIGLRSLPETQDPKEHAYQEIRQKGAYFSWFISQGKRQPIAVPPGRTNNIYSRAANIFCESTRAASPKSELSLYNIVPKERKMALDTMVEAFPDLQPLFHTPMNQMKEVFENDTKGNSREDCE